MRSSKLASSLTILFFLLTFIFSFTIPANAWYHAEEVIDYIPGTNVSPPYMNPAEALGVPELLSTPLPDGRATFVSLGIGGSLILGFSRYVIIDGPGTDFQVTEVGTAEKCYLYGSNDYGQTWVPMGISWGRKNYAAFDLANFPALNGEINALKFEDGWIGEKGAPFAGSDIDGVTVYYAREVVLGVTINIDPEVCFPSDPLKYSIELPMGFLPEQIDVPTVEMLISALPNAETAQTIDINGNGINELTLESQNTLMVTVRGKLINGMRFTGSNVLIIDEDDGQGENGKKNQNQEQNQEQEGWHYGGGNDHQDNGQHVGDKHCQ